MILINVLFAQRTEECTDAWKDTQKGRRTCRHMDGHAGARTDTRAHGRTCRCTDADADARMQTQAHDGALTLNMHACSAWVGKSSRRRTRLDERTGTFEMHYIYNDEVLFSGV